MTKATLSPQLNEELMVRALRNHHNINENSASDLKLKKCYFKRSSASGDNFCSDIYQADVEYDLNGSSEQKSLFVKIMIPEMNETGSNEEIMLTKVLPTMENILKATANKNQKLYAKCLLVERVKDEIYVLENLNSLGYYCADRIEGLDFQQAQVLMKKIATFHAVSMLFAKKFPTILQSMYEGAHFEKGVCDSLSKSINYDGLEYVAKMVEHWPSYEDFADKIRGVVPKYKSSIKDIIDTKNSKFNVINHGDLWVNNILFNYDEASKNCVDAIFVDFQFSFWGSCGIDINDFLNSSVKLNVLRENRQELIKVYFNNLCKTLVEINYPADEIPSLQDLLDEIKRCELIGLYTAICELPLVCMNKSISQNFDFKVYNDPDKGKEIRALLYDNPRVIETLKYTLKYFEQINVL